MSEPFEENLESTESRRMKIQTKATFLETYLHIQSKMDMYPLDAQEDLRYDSARLLFLVLPDEVVAIDLSESQQVSKESSLPDGQKQRWTIKQVDKYRGKLLSELGQKWEPII